MGGEREKRKASNSEKKLYLHWYTLPSNLLLKPGNALHQPSRLLLLLLIFPSKFKDTYGHAVRVYGFTPLNRTRGYSVSQKINYNEKQKKSTREKSKHGKKKTHIPLGFQNPPTPQTPAQIPQSKVRNRHFPI